VLVAVESTKTHRGVGVDVEFRIDEQTYISLSGDLLKLTYVAAPYETAVGSSIFWKGGGGPVTWTVRLGGPEIEAFTAARNQKAIQKRVEALRKAVEAEIKANQTRKT
jgi:hypothetical protein